MCGHGHTRGGMRKDSASVRRMMRMEWMMGLNSTTTTATTANARDPSAYGGGDSGCGGVGVGRRRGVRCWVVAE